MRKTMNRQLIEKGRQAPRGSLPALVDLWWDFPWPDRPDREEKV